MIPIIPLVLAGAILLGHKPAPPPFEPLYVVQEAPVYLALHFLVNNKPVTVTQFNDAMPTCYVVTEEIKNLAGEYSDQIDFNCVTSRP